MTGTPKTPPVAPGASINEDVFYAGGPAKGDLITNLLFGLTLIGIPFAVGAIVRALWLRFRITSRRIEVNGGWLGRDPRNHPKKQCVHLVRHRVRPDPVPGSTHPVGRECRQSHKWGLTWRTS